MFGLDALLPLAAKLLPLFMLAATRVGVLFASLPAPFGSVAPTRIRSAFTAVVTAAICMPLAATTPDLPIDGATLFRAGLGELLLGAVIGMTVRVTLAAADMAGSIAGQSMGLGFATSVDPSLGETTLPTTHLLSTFSMVIFFAFEGHHAVLEALYASFVAVPIGHEFQAFAHADIINLGSGMMARGLQIASPVVGTMFIVQLGTALASRAAPRVQLFAFSFSVAVAAGILALWISMPSLATAIDVQVSRLPSALADVFGSR